MRELMTAEHAAAWMTIIQSRMRWLAVLVPLALLAMVSGDGVSGTDIGVIGFVTIVLWLFVFLTGFTADALRRTSAQRD